MLSDFLKSAIFTWVLNGAFFLLIGATCVFAMQSLRRGVRQNYVEYAPTLMTSLGLFGTFLGIFLGLLQFDPKHIDGSIHQLLNGLQTAFVTSIIGMAFAIWFKVKQTSHMDSQKSADVSSQPADIEPKDIHSVLLKQHTALSFIAKGIGGDGDRSLVGQLQMLRTDVGDFRSSINKRQESFENRLWTQMDSFAEMMSKSATQQVIEALKQVIVEFNQKLSEQFGDNFKRLDESVKKLVDWQHNYMHQLDEMTQLYRLGTESIGATKAAIESIRTETSRIPQDMQLLSNVINVNQHQINELTRHLDAFVAMRDQAVIAVPQIKQQLEQVGQQLLVGADQVKTILMQGSQEFESSVKQTNNSLINSASQISSQSEKISDDLKNSLDLLAFNTERIRTGITSSISESMMSVESRSKDIVAKSGEVTNALLMSLQQSTQFAIDSSTRTRADTQTTIDATNAAMLQHADRSLQAVEKQVNDIVAKSGEVTNALLMSLQQSMQFAIDGSARTRADTQTTIDATNAAMLQHADRSLQAVEKQVQEAVNRTNEAVNAQLHQLDEALSRQLNAALEELGTSLASIAGHLMKTYQRSNERTRSLVE